MPDRVSRRRTALGVFLALLAGVVFAVSITLLATRVASPEIGLENSPVVFDPVPSSTIPATVDTNVPTLSPSDEHGSDNDSDDD